MKRLILNGAIAALFSFSACVVHAGYAQLQPPAGWTSTPGASPTFNMAAAANSATLSNGTVRTSATLNVAGRSVSIPASLRFASNSPRIVAAALFASPHLRTAIGIASWLGLAKVVWDAGLNEWVTPQQGLEVSNGLEYAYSVPGNASLNGGWHSSKSAACEAYFAAYISGSHRYYNYVLDTSNCTGRAYDKISGARDPQYDKWGEVSSRQSASCPAGWYVTPAGCVQTPPPRRLDVEEFIEVLDPVKMPDSVPDEIPNLPIPVDVPVINPSPDGDPGGSPSGIPLFVPTGNPVPNPNYNPNAPAGPENMPWLQPGVRVTPNPVPWAPWQVDIKPIYRPVPTPTPDYRPYPDRIPNPWDIYDPTREEKDDFCKNNSTSIICEKGDFRDKELSEIPKLYERKYPDGMTGIWNQKKEELKSSGLGVLAAAMMPTGINAGSCPSFQLDLSLVSWADYGVNDISPPCWVWDFGRVVIIIGALMLARQLIFGG